MSRDAVARRGSFYSVAWAVIGLAAASGGCLTQRPRATIDDCNGDGYRVVAVDGKPTVRASHPIHTVIPEVIVEPGEHTLTIHPDGADETFEIAATITSGAQYRVGYLVANVKPSTPHEESNRQPSP